MSTPEIVSSEMWPIIIQIHRWKALVCTVAECYLDSPRVPATELVWQPISRCLILGFHGCILMQMCATLHLTKTKFFVISVNRLVPRGIIFNFIDSLHVYSIEPQLSKELKHKPWKTCAGNLVWQSLNGYSLPLEWTVDSACSGQPQNTWWLTC